MQARADMVKAELSDTEGLGFKLEERQRDIMQLKTALKMKVYSLSLSSASLPPSLPPSLTHSLPHSLTHSFSVFLLLSSPLAFIVNFTKVQKMMGHKLDILPVTTS